MPSKTSSKLRKLAEKACAVTPEDLRLFEDLHQLLDVSSGDYCVGVLKWFLANGRFFAVQKRPKGFKLGKPNQCFKNAFDLFYDGKATYCEGRVAVESGLPFEHGWCVRDNKVVEVTLKKPADAYFGVPIDMEMLGKAEANWLPALDRIIWSLISKKAKPS